MLPKKALFVYRRSGEAPSARGKERFLCIPHERRHCLEKRGYIGKDEIGWARNSARRRRSRERFKRRAKGEGTPGEKGRTDHWEGGGYNMTRGEVDCRKEGAVFGFIFNRRRLALERETGYS